MKQFLFRCRFQVLIVITGLLWLLGLNALLQFNVQQFIFPDSQDYLLAAHELFINHTFHCYRAIVMAFFTGLPYFFEVRMLSFINGVLSSIFSAGSGRHFCFLRSPVVFCKKSMLLYWH